LTNPLFFDTDCLSAFLWIDGQSLLPKLFPGRIVIPSDVYAEIDKPCIQHLKKRVDGLLTAGEAQVAEILVGTPEYELFFQMTELATPIIGKGEAAALVLAKFRGGIVASNNLRDVRQYVQEYDLQLMTTGDILALALERGFITEKQGNKIWKEMLSYRRKLGATSFSEFLRKRS
jgi:predicted nucleic acid-binding protein